MGDDIKAIYASSWAFALALPLLFVIPAIPEFLQHVIEIKLGMYASTAAAHAMAQDGSRLGFGYAKILSLLLPTYWLTRYMAFGGNARRAWALEWPAIGLWLALFVVQGALQAWGLFGPSTGALIGLSGRSGVMAGAAVSLLASVGGIYLMCWEVGWPLGNAACGPLTSIRLMMGSFWRTIGYLFAGTLPLMAVHYALGLGAIGRPIWLVWPMLIVDAFSVAMLAHTVAASSFVAARHAAQRDHYSLVVADTVCGVVG